MSSIEGHLTSLTQRELRNESGAVLRSVAAGESFVITNRGEPVAKIVPLDGAALGIVRPAVRHGGWSNLDIARLAGVDANQILEDVRADR